MDRIDWWHINLQETWKYLLGEDVLSLKKSLAQWAREHGADPVRLLTRLKKIPEFLDWYDEISQKSLRTTEKKKSIRIGDYIIPDEWKEALGKETLIFNKTFKSRLAELGIKYPKSYLKYFKQSEEFNSWFNPKQQQSLGGSLAQKNRGSEISAKRSATLKERYGSSNLQQIEHVVLKRKETNCRKYGGDSPFASFEIKDKSKKANILKYGKEHPFKKSEEQIYEDLILSGIEPIERILSKKINIPHKGKCLTCGNIFTFHFVTDSQRPSLCPFCSKHSTSFERDLARRLTLRGFLVETHYYRAFQNSKVNRQEIDIFLPDYKIGLEINGIFSHNSSISFLGNEPKADTYHLTKTEEAIKQGIELIHIWEHEPYKSMGLKFLEKRLNNDHLNFSITLPDTFKLRRDFYPQAPQFEGYTVEWRPEVWYTDRNGKILDATDSKTLVTYTSGLWVYNKIK